MGNIHLNFLGGNKNIAGREENDFYATDPKAMELLLELEKFNTNVWECACGEKHLVKVLEKHGYKVKSSDIVIRTDGVENIDFLECTERFNGDVITNPPYKFAEDFIKKAHELTEAGNKIAMFLKLQFLEGKRRQALFRKYPPKTVYVSSSRLICARNGEFDKYNSSFFTYCWFVWENGYKGETKIRWFN